MLNHTKIKKQFILTTISTIPARIAWTVVGTVYKKTKIFLFSLVANFMDYLSSLIEFQCLKS
jgi:hypothetical protein